MATTTSLRRLQDDRVRLAAEMQRVLDGAARAGRNLTGEETQEYELLERELDQLGARLSRERRQRLHELDADDVVERRPRRSAYAAAFEQYLRRGPAGLDSETRALLERRRLERRDQTEAVDSAGGFLVPIEFQRLLALHALQAGAFRMSRAGEAALVTPTGAAAWWLERSFPDRWGRRGRVEHDHAGGVGITLTQLVKLASEEEDEVA